MRPYTLYLTDIADALEKIEEFAAGMTYDDAAGMTYDDAAGMTYDEFLLDDKTQSAVIYTQYPNRRS